MKKLYMRKLGLLVLLMIGLGLPGLASYTSNSVSGSFDDPAVWSPSPVPSEKYRTITIVSGAILYKEGSFSWDAKVTIQQNAKFNVGSGFSTGYGGIDISGELDVDGQLTGSNGGAAFNVKNGAVVTVNGVADNTNITVENGGVLIVNGDFSLSQTLTINQGGSVIINGNFLNGVVKNYGSFVVNGDYVNNAGDGIEVFGTGRTKVYGNMTGDKNFRVYKDGALLVFGNFASTGSNVHIQGTLVVAGDFLTSSSTTVNGADGNLIVGGDFKASGGINTKSDNLYILDPNSDIDYPQNGNGNKQDYGGLVDLIKNEDDYLKDLIEEVIPDFVNYASINQWVGGEDSEWVNEKNWTGNSVPEPGASVRIKSSGNNPVIRDGNPVLLDNLTINPSAKLTLSYGAQITVKGDLNINSVGGLILENKVGPDGLSSLITNGEVNGQVNVKMNIEGDRWYYLSSPVKTPTYSDFGVDENSPKDFRLDVYRRARWISIALEYAESRIRDLEGVAVKNYLGGTHSIDMVGELNSGKIVRAFAEGGWHIFGNPYPSAIQWSSSVGWEKENILPTIWFRTEVGSELTYVTYNAESDISSHTPEDASEYYTEGDDFSLIPPYQAVWIRTATDAPASITVDNRVRLHEKLTDEDVKVPQPQLKGGTLNKGEFSKIRIVAANEFSRDGSVIYFSDTNAEGFGTEDSEKYFNDSKNVPEVYTMLGNRSLAINGVPNVAESVKSFPISVRNRVEGNVSLRFDLREYNGEHDVYFEDKETGAFLNVERNSIYDYSVNRTGECHDRFVLHLYKVTTDIEEVRSDNDEVAAGEAISIKSVGGKVLVSASMDLVQQNPGNIGIYTIDGRKISEIPARSSRTLVLLPNERGVYIVRAQFGQLVKSQRVINAAQ